MSNKYKFYGHESFNCRQIWLKKGFDFVKNNGNFNSPDAVVELGVGKNMVSSIHFWLLAFGILQEDKQISQFGEFIFGANGADPFLENPATTWLLHYNLITSNYASIYNLFFNELKKEKLDYDSKSLLNTLIQKCNLENYNYNKATLEKDLAVFLRNYTMNNKKEKNLEDEFSGIFIENNILDKVGLSGSDNFQVVINDRQDIPSEIILFAILDQFIDSDSISFYNVLTKNNSVGNCFLISEDGLYKKLLDIQNLYSNVVFKEDSGIKEIQIKNKIDKWEVLREYYAK